MKVHIKTPARLHLGLIDMNGDLGRLFGGLGLGIDKPNVILQAQPAQKLVITGQNTQLATTLAQKFFQTYQTSTNFEINIQQTIPDHVGLGSGTQLALAIATALQKLTKTQATTPQLATTMGRAQRTAVGTTIFQQGGFVVDGGKNQKTQTFPPLIFRQPFPKEWRFIVAIPNSHKGLANHEEKHAFKQLTPMTPQTVGKICRTIMMQLLPALAEHDIQTFGQALTQIQATIGDNFASAQGGRYASQAATDTIAFLKKQGAHGTGQSSWGPTVYGLFHKEQAKTAKRKTQRFLQESVGGEVFVAKANNNGAQIKITT